jgi:glycosyltransferase involved in cell wall biosynthesis
MPHHASTRVSVGLPVHNGAARLPNALDELLGQTYADLDLLVSDNASDDATPEICLAYAARDARVDYERLPENEGAVANFNRVLERARGEYFMWAAHDDNWEPSYVATLVRLLDESPDAVLAFTGFDNVTEDGVTTRRFDAVQGLGRGSDSVERALEVMTFPERDGKANLLYGLVRTSVLRSLGGLRSHTPKGWGSDYHLVFELAWRGRFVSVQDVLFHKTLTNRDDSASLEEQYAYAAVYPRLARRLGASPLALECISAASLRYQLRATALPPRYRITRGPGGISLGTGLRARMRAWRDAGR